MSLLQAIVLGIVQGLTEFLPISSTAHLRIVPAIVGWDDPGSAFTAVIQLGTTGAVLIFFREDLWRIAKTWYLSLRRRELRSSLDARMGWYIGLGT
ncbi:MAG: pyrophosphate phosphatase, partial [Jatrophihabitans sp.]|nr:pyrophosphate phosphatase [Jatrophihabitans sp.]